MSELRASSIKKSPATVLIHVVTFNHAQSIAACLGAASRQTGYTLGTNLFILITDNASSDNSIAQVSPLLQPGIILEQESCNIGFTGAHNKGVEALNRYAADYLLLLNPDVALNPDCLQTLVHTLEHDPYSGAVVPKLLRAHPDLSPIEPPVIDAAGMIMTASMRHFDRGAQEPDCGQYDSEEYVFGGSGACLLLRKNCIQDISFPASSTHATGQLLCDAFFAYREDAELAWRMQRMGWSCRYQAKASAFHVRRVTPERRAALPSTINALGVQNRAFLSLLHLDLGYWKYLPAISLRWLLVLAACVSIERQSLKGLQQAWTRRKEILHLRKHLQNNQRVGSLVVSRWFSKNQDSLPALPTRQHAEISDQENTLTKVDVVIINFNSGQRLHKCLQKLLSVTQDCRPELSVRIIVHDNASDDGSATRVEPLFRALPHFTFIFSEQNLGFAGGIQNALHASDADAYLVLNPDVEVVTEALEALVDELTTYPQLAAVAPVLIGETEQPQYEFCLKSLPTLSASLAEILLLHRLWKNNPWTQSWRIDQHPALRSALDQDSSIWDAQSSIPLLVEQPPAACLLIRREAFETVDGFDTHFWPAWFEDVDFCKRLHDAGFFCGIVPHSRMIHEGGYSAKTLDAAHFREIWFRNFRRYWDKHGSVLEKTLIAATIPLGLLLRALLLSPSQLPFAQRKAMVKSAWRFVRGFKSPTQESHPRAGQITAVHNKNRANDTFYKSGT